MSEQKSYIEKAERWFGDTLIEQSAQVMATLAIAEAINAQTEQLKRIADALEAAHELATNPYRQP